MSHPGTNKIDEQAAAWVARLDRAELSPEDQQALDAWIAADVRHFGAFARALAVFVHFDRAGALGSTDDTGDDDKGPDPLLNRRVL